MSEQIKVGPSVSQDWEANTLGNWCQAEDAVSLPPLTGVLPACITSADDICYHATWYSQKYLLDTSQVAQLISLSIVVVTVIDGNDWWISVSLINYLDYHIDLVCHPVRRVVPGANESQLERPLPIFHASWLFKVCSKWLRNQMIHQPSSTNNYHIYIILK